MRKISVGMIQLKDIEPYASIWILKCIVPEKLIWDKKIYLDHP